MRLTLLTSSSCTLCKDVEAKILSQVYPYIGGEVYDIDSEEGVKLLARHKIKAIPALIVDDVNIYSGIDEITERLKLETNTTNQ